MSTINEEVRISGIEDIFARYPEYHQIKLICRLEDIRSYELKKMSKSEQFDNVSTFPRILYEYEIAISGSAFNCFENCPVNIFMTFGQDKLAWEKCQKIIANVVNSHHVVKINADVYNIQDGEFSLFNPILLPANYSAQNMGDDF
jgi:hypothetical protein